MRAKCIPRELSLPCPPGPIFAPLCPLHTLHFLTSLLLLLLPPASPTHLASPLSSPTLLSPKLPLCSRGPSCPGCVIAGRAHSKAKPHSWVAWGGYPERLAVSPSTLLPTLSALPLSIFQKPTGRGNYPSATSTKRNGNREWRIHAGNEMYRLASLAHCALPALLCFACLALLSKAKQSKARQSEAEQS